MMINILVARAPLRVSFSGGGSDTPEFTAHHVGHVLSMTIARYATVWGYEWREGMERAVAPMSYPSYETDHDLLDHVELDFDGKVWHGNRTDAPSKSFLKLVSYVDVPPRSGLGASGALTVAALACECVFVHGETLTNKNTLADDACYFEREKMRIAGGQQDQYAAAFGGLNLMTFDGDNVRVYAVNLPRDTLLQLQSSLLLVYIHSRQGSSHQAMGEEIMQVEKGNKVVLEALVEQAAIPERMVKALHAGDMEAFGLELGRAWSVKKRQSPSVTNDVVDAVYELARKAGALGGKLVGAGGGGYMLLFAPGRVGPVVDAMMAVGLRPEPVVFEPEGVRVWHEYR